MHIGLYNPYYDGFGGGELYTLTLAAHWSRQHTVDLFWDDPAILGVSEKRFHIDLSRVSVVPNIFATNKFFSKLAISKQYDLIFFLSDGSIPTSLAAHNILHFQVPFAQVRVHPFKMSRFDAIVCNSQFTQSHLDPRLHDKTMVIYPPVRQVPSKGGSIKEKLILSVGRFTSMHTAKKQEVMIDAFIRMETRLPGWKLVLAGGLLSSDADYVAELAKKASGHRIRFVHNISRAALETLYRKATIYWHAAGYGESDPTCMEHFGISTVEAMSAGVVPIVYKGGGQPEIVVHDKNGLLWTTSDVLRSQTLQLVADKKWCMRLQKSASTTWKRFSQAMFMKSYDEIIRSI